MPTSRADIPAAQAAAAIENLLIATYQKVLTLDVVQALPAPEGPALRAFLATAMSHHQDHLQAFNAAAARLGGRRQTAGDAALDDGVVGPGLRKLSAPLDVAQFGAQLERIASATYASAPTEVTDSGLRDTFSSIMGVEAQHAAVFAVIALLFDSGRPGVFAVPADAARVPSDAGAVGLPAAFVARSDARSLSEAPSP